MEEILKSYGYVKSRHGNNAWSLCMRGGTSSYVYECQGVWYFQVEEAPVSSESIKNVLDALGIVQLKGVA